jgi:hypothetical protein
MPLRRLAGFEGVAELAERCQDLLTELAYLPPLSPPRAAQDLPSRRGTAEVDEGEEALLILERRARPRGLRSRPCQRPRPANVQPPAALLLRDLVRRVRSISPPGSVLTITHAPHVNLIELMRYHNGAFFDRVLTVTHAPHVTASPVKS